MDSLKKCPFCGGEAEYRQFFNPKNYYSVVCSVCHCGTDGYRNLSDASDSENKARQAAIWNTRTYYERLLAEYMEDIPHKCYLCKGCKNQGLIEPVHGGCPAWQYEKG